MAKRNKHDSTPTKLERTGEKDFIVKHDDGSAFECKVDDPQRFNSIKGLRSKSKIFSFGGIGERKPLICDNCKKQVHKITYINSRSLCERCL